MEFGFEGGTTPPSNDGSPINDPVNPAGGGQDPQDINDPANGGNPPADGNNNPDGGTPPADAGKPNDGGEDGGEPLEAGTIVEFEGQSYTANDKGDLIDAQGNVFKKAEEIQAWLKEMSVESNDPKDGEIDINSIQQALGYTLVGEDNKPIEFENNIEGVKSYVQSVIEQTREEHYNEAVTNLFATYPIVKDFLDYYVANGNSFVGFGERPDRSAVEFQLDNEAQHIAIIRTAWQESNRPGDVEAYIEYLKNTNTLAHTAELELNAMKEADAKYKKELAEEASRKEAEQIEYERQYWSGIQQKINQGVVGNYKIPEVISITRDGQKHNVTRNHFFEYLYHRDKEGYSRYQRDIQNMKQEDIDNDQLIRAYLMFTGGSYDTLIDMAMKKKQLSTLKVQAIKKTSGSVKINKPNSNNGSAKLDLGFN